MVVISFPLRWCGWRSYLLVDLLRGLSVAEGHGSQVFQDGHFHGAVAPVQERHQRARVHRPVHDLGPDTWKRKDRSVTLLFKETYTFSVSFFFALNALSKNPFEGALRFL